ncbi:MAG TPA: hypothetical protein DCG53_14585 [Syntrophus sp. (in: bacteria)]|nr:hypothetical protein [Syntrophus sp. (in: bacteria)]
MINFLCLALCIIKNSLDRIEPIPIFRFTNINPQPLAVNSFSIESGLEQLSFVVEAHFIKMCLAL